MDGTKIAGFRRKSYKTLGQEARKTTLFQRKINDMSVVQGELLSNRRCDFRNMVPMVARDYGSNGNGEDPKP